MFLLVACSLTGEASADSFRCGRKVIREGDSRSEVLRRCGEPRYKDRGREIVSVDRNRKKVSVERWYYKKSSRSLERVVMIHGGRVVAVEIGGR